MRTLRTIPLVVPALLASFTAAAQSTASGPTPTTVLSWVVWWAAGVVMLMAIITSASVSAAVQRRYVAQPATTSAVAEATPEQAQPREATYAASSLA